MVFVVHSPGGLGCLLVHTLVLALWLSLVYVFCCILWGVNWFRCCCLVFISVAVRAVYVGGRGSIGYLGFNNIKYIHFSVIIM